MIKYKEFKAYNRTTLPIYNKLVLDPLARLISIPIINYTNIKPYIVTFISLGISIFSAYCFYVGNYLIAAILFQFSVVLDCVDGYIARIKKNGSVFGMIFDAYSDIIRVVLNVLALIIGQNLPLEVKLLLATFLSLNFAESWIDLEMVHVNNFLRRLNKTSLNRLDILCLKLKIFLEKFGLRTNFLYYQERLFCVLFLGPIFDNIKLFTIIGIALIIFSIHFKIIFDVALIKNAISNNTDEELRTSEVS